MHGLNGGTALQNKFTRNIISKDKNLREQIEFLELEKAHLDDTVFKEKELILQAFEEDLKNLIKKTKQENAKALKEKETLEKTNFEKRLAIMNDIYQKEKDAWIESIFRVCIDSGDSSE